MLVVCCGMRRSFSTLLYQIVGEIYKWKNSLGDLYEYYHDGLNLNSDIFYVKIHDKEKDILDTHKKYLFSFRDIRDVFASYRSASRNFHPRISVVSDTILKRMIDSFYYFNKQKNMIKFRYEDYIEKEYDIVSSICQFLQVFNIDVKRLAEKLSFKKQKEICDKLKYQEYLTLHYPQHLSDGKINKYKKYLTPFEIDYINAVCYDWLAENRYQVDKRMSPNDVLDKYNAVLTKKNDTLNSMFGTDWRKIYFLECNKDFRKIFPNPNQIRAGYIIFTKPEQRCKLPD